MKNNCIFYILSFLTFLSGIAFGENVKRIDPSLESKVRTWADQPVAFLENKGQMTDMEGIPVPFVLFKASAPGLDMYITEKGLTYVFLKVIKGSHERKKRNEKRARKQVEWSRVDMILKGANIRQENIVKEEINLDFSNYFFAHCPDGITNVRAFKKITIREIYPGIDWVLYNSNGQGFKYDFIVHPGANPRQIEMAYASLNPLQLDEAKNIVLKTKQGTLTEQAPYSYVKETNTEVKTEFQISDQQPLNEGYETTIGFKLSGFKGLEGQTLIIDPQLVWATFYGGNGDDGFISIDCDAAGNVFGTGETNSFNFPPLNPAGGAYFQGTSGTNWECFILKFTNAGVLLWATYYGGNGEDTGKAVHIDAAGNFFVTGLTSSTNFPVQNLPGAYNQPALGGSYDAFILKFDNNGVRSWATYFGGSAIDWGHSIITDGSGNLIVTGFTASPNFPLQNLAGAYNQPAIGGARDAFILKFSAAGALLWSTYYGGSGDEESYSAAVDAADNLFVTGFTASSNFPSQNAGTFFQGTYGGGAMQYGDAFILKFNSAGSRLWATYYGGSGDDGGSSVVVTQSGDVFVAGITRSSNFPLQNLAGAFNQVTIGGNSDAFLLKFNNTGTCLWATYYGGSSDEEMLIAHDNLAVSPCGTVYMSFETKSSGLATFPPCDGGYYNTLKAGSMDLFIARFTDAGVPLWATYLGGDGKDFSPALAVDSAGNLFCAGEWTTVGNSASYPLVDPGGGAMFDATSNATFPKTDDAFITKFNKIVPVLTTSVVNAGCGCTGVATVTTSSTCGPSYLWSNGQTTQTISGLCAGSYSVSVTDQLCNTGTTAVTIGAGSGLSVSVSQTGMLCNGGNTGSAAVSASGGTSPYTYAWSPSGGTGSVATGLSAGTYTVSITDTNSCTGTGTVAIASVGGAAVSLSSQTNVSCNGGSNGAAAVTATGGSSPYTYNWLPSGGSTSAASGLSAGNYTVMVTDASGCSSSQTVTITQPAAIISSVVSTPEACQSGNGTAGVSVAGGSLPYVYLWNSGQTNQTATGLSAGNYSVLITDANGCTAAAATTVAVSPPPVANATPATICAGQQTTLVASGGGTYAWNTAETTSTIIVSPTISTSYSVIVSIGNCIDTANTSVTVNPSPTAMAWNDISITMGANTTLSSSGGGTYLWSNGSMDSVITVSPVITTIYCVTVSKGSCTDNACVTVTVEPINCSPVSNEDAFTLPSAFSPNEDGQNDTWRLLYGPLLAECIAEVHVLIYNRWGEKVFEGTDITFSWDGKYNGKIEDTAVFGYHLTGIMKDKTKINKKGNISLIR